MSIPILNTLPLSLIDYPEKMSFVIFTHGCNLVCPYCHNHELLKPLKNFYPLNYDDVIKDIQSREKFIGGIVITGGEPSIHGRKLITLLEKLRKDFPDKFIKLDTNGTNPELICECFENNLIDYLALDIKTTPNRYRTTLGWHSKLMTPTSAFNLILRGAKKHNIKVNLRTTLVPHLIDQEFFDFVLYITRTYAFERYNIQVGNLESVLNPEYFEGHMDFKSKPLVTKFLKLMEPYKNKTLVS